MHPAELLLHADLLQYDVVREEETHGQVVFFPAGQGAAVALHFWTQMRKRPFRPSEASSGSSERIAIWRVDEPAPDGRPARIGDHLPQR